VLASYRELFAGLSAISRLTGSVRISLFVVTITPDLSGTIDQKLALQYPFRIRTVWLLWRTDKETLLAQCQKTIKLESWP
jgi:hypothetical protein